MPDFSHHFLPSPAANVGVHAGDGKPILARRIGFRHNTRAAQETSRHLGDRVIEPLREISTNMRRLSAYIAGALKQPLPPAILAKARQHILDTMAAMISGTRLPPGKLAIAYVTSLGGVRQASVIGTRLLTSAVHAALANGMLAHADETDDSHAPSRTDPGCAVIPAALAAAESARASGEDFIRAVVLGYDVAARINYALDPEALAASLCSTHSVGGTFGAGAAADAVLGVHERPRRHLMPLCAQQASGGS